MLKDIKTWYNYLVKRGIFMVKITTEFITLTQFLKINDFISSGGEAKYFLQEQEVFVNQEKEERRGRKLYVNDEVVINQKKFIIE